MLDKILCLGIALILIPVVASAADCPKPDKGWFDGKIASYSMCLSQKANAEPSLKGQSPEQITAFFDQQTDCKKNYDQAMGYIYKMAECQGKPMNPAQQVNIAALMKKQIYAVLEKDIH